VTTAQDVDRTPALRADDLVKRFRLRNDRLFGASKYVHAVDGVSVTIMPGQTLGIVGESGCGKSTLGRLLIGLSTPDAGTVMWADRPAGKHDGRVQAVFQDPSSALNPRQRVSAAIAEPLRHSTARDAERRVRELAQTVGLGDELLGRYPHELSGGQQQRVCIARALAPGPNFILLDEAVSSLDASLQMQVIALLKELQDTFGSAYAFISHDLRAVRAVSDQIAVMYLGELVEVAPASAFNANLLHPYAVALRSAEPSLPTDSLRVERIILRGEPPSAVDVPAGCRFAARCPVVQDLCRTSAPALTEVLPGHLARCHFPGSLSLRPRADAGDGVPHA
jgi:oligopeptide/dipeptide ABC transporter ATP-binding protein